MAADALLRANSRGTTTVYWATTALFSVAMAFSALAYLTTPTMAQAFTHLGFPPYFRVELAIAKGLGVIALLAPVPARVKEWAYAGFGITLLSAFVAHFVVDGPEKAISPIILFAILALSYVTRMRREAP